MKRFLFYVSYILVTAISCNTQTEQSNNTQDIALNDKAGLVNGAIEERKSVYKQEEALRKAKQPATDGTIAITDTSVAPGNNIFQSGDPGNTDWDKKIIKTAHVILELKDYNNYNASIHNKLKVYGAYIAQEQQQETDNQISNEISIKVPVDKFDDLVNSLSGDGVKLLEKNIVTEDVTGQVVDTKARMEAKKQVRARYLELLKDAKKMDDILQVQNEINSIQEDIESATGRINYLVHASAYSTINLKYFQYLNGLTSKDVEPNFFTKLNEAFKNGASVVTNLLLFFISIWPLLIAAVVIIIYMKRLKLKKA